MMDRSPKKLDSGYVFERSSSSEPQENDLSAFLNFPSLSRLFQGVDRAALSELRSQLTQTNQYFERVIGRATKEDADRAVLILRSTITLTFAGGIGRPLALKRPNKKDSHDAIFLLRTDNLRKRAVVVYLHQN